MGMLREQLEQATAEEYGAWKSFFEEQAALPYFDRLDQYVSRRAAVGTVYPPPDKILNAFRLTPAGSVRVLVLGQDPYHEPGQAMGLAFSVPDGVKAPPSLRNILKELESDVGPGAGAGTDLSVWARQGVLCLNTVLTVDRGAAASHAKKGWETFTQGAIAFALEQSPHPVAALLWGAHAQGYQPLIEGRRGAPVCCICSAHPSPLSAHKGFLGSRPFSRANEFLRRSGEPPVRWELGDGEPS